MRRYIKRSRQYLTTFQKPRSSSKILRCAPYFNSVLGVWKCGQTWSVHVWYIRAWTNDKYLATKHHQTLFGDQNMLMLKWVAKRLKYVWSNTDRKQLIQAAEQAWYACPLQTCLIRGCQNKTSPIKHEYKRNVLSYWLNVWWPSRPYTIKHIQTRSNSTKQGVQTVKCLVTKQCLMVFSLVAKHLLFVQALTSNTFNALVRSYLPRDNVTRRVRTTKISVTNSKIIFSHVSPT